MTRLIRAELAKVRTTRMVYGMAAGLLGGVVLAVASSIVRVDHDGNLSSKTGIRDVMGSAGWGVVLVLVLGIVAMAGEFRHDTITPTLLATPQRGRVVGAKLASSAVVGGAFAIASAVITLAVAVPWMVAKDVDLSLVRSEAPSVFLGVFVATALYGAIGVGVGSLIRNQTLAVVASLVWIMIVENLLLGLAPGVGRWLPAGAASAVMRSVPAKGELLSMWAGGLLLMAYAAAISVAGVRLAVRRDVS